MKENQTTPPVSAPTLSIIIPMYNEAEVLDELNKRLGAVLSKMDITTELVFIDDGSTDGSFELCESLKVDYSEKVVLKLSRNFGKEAAMSAGLKYCRGEAIILIDSDLQDPPELIPQMVEKWKEGYDVINMQRISRGGETWFKKLSAKAFYRVINHLSTTDIPENVGDFRLLSRRVIDQINSLPERNLYMKGLLSWPGFNQVIVQFDRDARWGGETKWNYFQLFSLAVDGITAFSTKPLRLATWLGAFVALSAFTYGLWVVFKTLIIGESVSGYPSLMVVMLGLGGMQLLSIGVIGSYLGRVFNEVKSRPNFIIQDITEQKPPLTPREVVSVSTTDKELKTGE